MLPRSIIVRTLLGVALALTAAASAWAQSVGTSLDQSPAGHSVRLSGAADAASVSGSVTPNIAPPEDRRQDALGAERNLFSGREDVGVDLYQHNGLRIGTLAGAAPGAALGGSSGTFMLGKALGWNTASGEVGAFAEYSYDRWRLSADARQDLSNQRGGTQLELAFGYGAKLASDVSLTIGPRVTLGGMNGIGPLGSQSSAARGANSATSLHDLSASASVNWRILEGWNLTGFAGARQLVTEPGAGGDGEGQSGVTQYFTGVTLGYHF